MPDRPNILLIMTEQHRGDCLGIEGHPCLLTPNMDSIGAGGARFTNNFCNSPVCVSSRVCVLTGLYPEDTGVYNNEGAWPRFRLPRPLETFPRIFAEHGYRTANFGKVHVARDLSARLDRHAAGAVEVPADCLRR